MPSVRVEPREFHYVAYEAAVIEQMATPMVQAVGFGPDEVVTIEIDERTFFGRSRVLNLEPLHLQFESGAFEDAKRPRHFSPVGAAESLGVVLFRAHDRRSPGFVAAPADEELDLAQRVAWDTWAAGRCERQGWQVSKPRRHYHFRTRHGFSDESDAAFERIWSADEMTWAALDSISRALRATAP